jgi:hypothetical protein
MTNAHQPTANLLRAIGAAAEALATADADRYVGRISAGICATSLRQAASSVLDGVAVRHPRALVGSVLDLDGADLTVVDVVEARSTADESGFLCTIGCSGGPGAATEVLPAWAVTRALVSDDPAHIALVCRRVATNLARPARHRFHVVTPRTRLACALTDATALVRAVDTNVDALDIARAVHAFVVQYPDLVGGATLIGLAGGVVVGSTAGDDEVPAFIVRERDGRETEVGSALLVTAHVMGRPGDALSLVLQLEGNAFGRLNKFARNARR